MSIPDFQSVMRPVLEAVRDGVAIPLSALRECIADVLQLTEDERKERLPSGHQTVINNRVGWSRTYLNKAGLLTIPSKGMVQITDRGRQALANGPARITVTWLKQFPEFADFHTAKPQTTEVLSVMGVWLWSAPRRPRMSNWLMLTRHLFSRSPKTFWHR